jgi:hypothetical protein
MAPVLDDLLSDGRLARLFSKDARSCALQLWILQIKSEQLIEHRVVYGRLLPYSHSSDSWYASDDDGFQTFGQFQAQVVRLNLYVKSARCADILRHLSVGRTILEISAALGLELKDQLKSRFGPTALIAAALAYRPVSYLLNRDAHDRYSPPSPHSEAGAFSASITQRDKGSLFRFGQDYDVALTASVVKHLNADTGLDFGGADTARFGDLELLVFPTLDDLERPLLSANWSKVPRGFVARFNPLQVPHFSGFQFRLCIMNDGQIIYSTIATAKPDPKNVFAYEFELGEQLTDLADSTELEIFGFHDNHSREGTLCCRWRVGYVREVHLQGHVVGHGENSVKFDWLERTARPPVAARVKAALTINRSDLGFANRIGGREADPWVPISRDLLSLFTRLHPPKSEGRFFLRWSQGNGEGRLQFVEWFKALLAEHQQHQVVIFDPYFDAAGLGLVLLCAAPKADYIVFTSLPKRSIEDEATPGESDKLTLGRINNLLANCEQRRYLLDRIKLRIYGLKEGRLHDRYILIMGSDRLPVAGFNLSNSLQKAAENFPLLVTPIPADVLLKVEQYKAGLVHEADATRSEGETKSPSILPLFDSTVSLKATRRCEPLRFLEKTQAGDVLSVWCGEPSLQRLSGVPLKERLAALDLLKDDALALPGTTGLLRFLEQHDGHFENFEGTWNVLGEVLAHSHAGDKPASSIRELKSKCRFLEFLKQFIEASFNRAHEEADNDFVVTNPSLFRGPVETLLHSCYDPHHLFQATKYTTLNWPEYFAIKFLWWSAPDALLAIAEAQMGNVPPEPQGPDMVRLSLLSQIVSEIALSVRFDIREDQRDRLVRSDRGLLQWMGLNAIEMQLGTPGGLAKVLQVVADLTFPERVRALGWMVHRAARNPKNAEIYKDLVAALHKAMPATILTKELGLLVDSMRGHMWQLAWTEPWLFQDVVCPLLQNDRANTDDACEIWVQELTDMLKPQLGQPRLFDRAREGQTTNITALLFAYSSPDRRRASLRAFRPILKRQRRIVQQPLASTSDWTSWDDALTVSMWILSFAKWVQYYLRERNITDLELEQFSWEAGELAMVRPMVDWRALSTGKHGELAGFLDQVDELLTENPRGAKDVSSTR